VSPEFRIGRSEAAGVVESGTVVDPEAIKPPITLYQEIAKNNNITLFRTKSRNTHPAFIRALFDLVISKA
jgi:hypothetical protein